MQWVRKVLIVIIAVALLLPAHSAFAGTFASQNGRIAVGKVGGGVWTVRPNGNQPQPLDGRTVSNMVWSPSGGQIALVEPQQNGATRLLVKDITTGAIRNLTYQTNLSDSEPVWSYNGVYIAFVRTKQGPSAKQSAVFTVKADGSEFKNVSGWSAIKSYKVPTWAPDNKRIAYEEIGENNARILIRDLVNGRVRELTALSDVSQPPLLAWSPSGKKLLFNDSEGQIYTIWADGTHRAVISDGDSYGASWSSDGSRVAFLEDFNGEYISISEPDGTISAIPLSLAGYSRVGAPVWSPNGKRLVFVATQASTSRRDLFSVAIAGGALPYRIAADVTDVVGWQPIVAQAQDEN